VDSVIVGDIESEKSHQFEEVSTATGLESGRSFRRAREGGWLSYQLAVNRGHRNDLVLEYYGVEIEPSRFTIQIDGHEIASVQDISKSHLPVNYGQVYPIPDALLEGKERVTVKLQALWPHPTARVFAIYCVTRDV
jgi:uncharacterized protein